MISMNSTASPVSRMVMALIAFLICISAVPVSGVLAIAGGLSIMLGYRAKIGAWLLVLFLMPVTVIMHNFWVAGDPMMAQMQQAMFLKNISMLGASLMIAHFGSGPLSLDGGNQR
jgi:putative oxidoreductase